MVQVSPGTHASARPAASKSPAPRAGHLAVRILLALAPGVPLGAVVGAEVARGWRPTSDDAAIAWRTLDVFSAHAPLLGAFNDATLSAGRPVFDLGPLQYYLLALPERLDPTHGILWGGALLAALLGGLSVEAAWRVFGPLAAGAVSVGFLVFPLTQDRVLLNIAWNPDLGLYAFSGLLVFAMAAAAGEGVWWPVAVACGCLAAQCHLIYAAGSLLALGGALLAGQRGSGRFRWRHLAGGVAVGALCFLPSVVEQLSDRPGNLSLLLTSAGRPGRRLGLAAGISALSHSALPLPLWSRPAPALRGQGWYGHLLSAVLSGPSVGGWAVLGAAALVATVALLAGRRLAGLAVVAVLAALGVAFTIGEIPLSQRSVITYLDVALWPVGMALDCTVVLGIAWAAVALANRLFPGGLRRRLARRSGLRAALLLGCAGIVGLAGLGLAVDLPAVSSEAGIIGGWAAAAAVPATTASITSQARPGPLLVEPAVPLLPDGLATWALVEATAYQLKTEGREARLAEPMAAEFGQDAVARRPTGAYLVTPQGDGWVVKRGRRRPLAVLGPLP